MPYKFQHGDLVFHQSTPEAPNVTGLYTVRKVGTDGMIYQLMDRDGDFTDANETEITPVTYALFIRAPEGWPIVVPAYDEGMYKRFLNSNMYEFVKGGALEDIMIEQAAILAKFEDDAPKGDEQATS